MSDENEKYIDPAEALLQRDAARASAVRELGTHLRELNDAIKTYAAAFDAAKEAGWGHRELVSGGFVDAARLPKRGDGDEG